MEVYKVVSYGQKKSGIKTAEVIILTDWGTQTRHLQRLNGEWRDNDGKKYYLPK